MQTIRIKPADGLQVRLEDGSGYLAADGQTVALTGYWHRRLADGDVIEATEETAAEAVDVAAEPEPVATPAEQPKRSVRKSAEG